MNQPQSNNGTIIGTIGGTLLSVFASVHTEDIVKTFVLALIGATVSFSASLILKKIASLFKRRT